VEFQLPFKELQVISILASPFGYSQALHTTHHHPMELQMETQGVLEEEAAGLHKEGNRDKGATETSSAIWKIVRWKKDSWDKANGIEYFLLNSRLLKSGIAPSLLHCTPSCHISGAI